MIRVHAELCSGCRQCEVACSFAHSSGSVARSLARIQVVKDEAMGLDYPVLCQQCTDRFCLAACPTGALSIGSLGEVLVDQAKCSGCGLCENACPIGAIRMHDDNPQVCNLCGGTPQCVQACTMQALCYEPDNTEHAMLRPADPGEGHTPDAKARQYAMRETDEHRSRWHTQGWR